jgi:hypothetical protein
MPVIDLRDPEFRHEAGLMTETVLIPSQSVGAVSNGRERAETARLVLELLHEHGPMTRLELCRALGRAKSPGLIALFEQMATEDQIRRGFTLTRNGRTAIIYGVEL